MVVDPDCIFCKIVAGEIPCFKLYEDELTMSFMDINPAAPGHCLVIAKEHAPNVFEIDEDALASVIRTAKRVASAVNAALAPEGINLLQANGPGAAQSVEHLHFHILPRSVGDDLLLNWPVEAGDMEAIGELAERIRGHV